MKAVVPGIGKSWAGSAGLYIIILLVLLRFLVYPLHSAVRDRSAALADQRESYGMKMRLLQQAELANTGGAAQDSAAIKSAVYPRGTSITEIQAGLVEGVSKSAESRGLTVTGFEMPEAPAGKGITEVPVVLRLKGPARPFIDLLESIQAGKKIIAARTMEITVSGQEMNFTLALRAFRMEES